MPLDTYGVWVPESKIAPAGAAQMAQMRDSFSSRLVMTAVDAADRDVKYPDAPKNLLVVSGDSTSMWLRVDDGNGGLEWKTFYSDTGDITTGFVAGTGWAFTDPTKPAVGRIRNGQGEVYIDMTRTGATITANSAGNINNELLVTVPSTLYPYSAFGVPSTARSEVTSGAALLGPNGGVNLLDMHPTSTIATNQTCKVAFTGYTVAGQ